MSFISVFHVAGEFKTNSWDVFWGLNNKFFAWIWLVLEYVFLPSKTCFICYFFSCIKVDSAWNSGRYEEARRNAKIAKILNIIGFAFGIAGWVDVAIGVIYSHL